MEVGARSQGYTFAAALDDVLTHRPGETVEIAGQEAVILDVR